MKLSESVVEGFGNQEVDSSVEDLSNKLANKIRILNDLKTETKSPNATIENDETVEKVIEETFKDKSIAKSFGDESVAAENDSIIAGWSPNSQHISLSILVSRKSLGAHQSPQEEGGEGRFEFRRDWRRGGQSDPERF